MCVDKHIILYYIHRYIDRFQRVSGCEEYVLKDTSYNSAAREL